MLLHALLHGTNNVDANARLRTESDRSGLLLHDPTFCIDSRQLCHAHFPQMARETCNNDRFVMHMFDGILLLRPVIIIKHECFNMVDGCGLRGRWLFRADCSDSEPPRNDRICS